MPHSCKGSSDSLSGLEEERSGRATHSTLCRGPPWGGGWAASSVESLWVANVSSRAFPGNRRRRFLIQWIKNCAAAFCVMNCLCQCHSRAAPRANTVMSFTHRRVSTWPVSPYIPQIETLPDRVLQNLPTSATTPSR